MRKIGLTVLFFGVFTAREVNANPGITGYSGKPYNGASNTCTTLCHGAGGVQPKLAITVPAAMKAGETAQVTIVVTGTRKRTSINAALSDGVKATAGQNTDIPFPNETPGEVGAVDPPPLGANGTYKFSFVAPQKNGPLMLWVAGMSADGASAGGDGVAKETRTITISGATTPPASEADAGAGAVDGGKSGVRASDAGAEEDDEESTSQRRIARTTDPAGCNLTPRTTSTANGGAMAALAIALILGMRRRQRS